MAATKAILGIVENHTQAGNVVAQLRLQGFPQTFLSVLFPDEGSASGRPGPGGAVGFFSNVAALALPGLGPVVAGGALVEMLRGSAWDRGAPGGLVACLTDLGIPLLEARQCEREVRAGNILIAVHVEHPRLRAFVQETLRSYGATGVETLDERTSPLGQAA